MSNPLDLQRTKSETEMAMTLNYMNNIATNNFNVSYGLNDAFRVPLDCIKELISCLTIKILAIH